MTSGESDGGRSAAAEDLMRLAWSSPDLLMMLDLHGTILAVNPAWGTALGWQRDELVGRPFVEFVHADDRDRAAHRWASVVDGNTIVDERNRWPTVDGSWRWLSWAVNQEAGSGNVFAAGRDVTEQMDRLARVTADRELLAAAERLADVGSWEWSLDLDVVTLSPHMRHLLGVGGRVEPVTAEELLQLLHPDDRERAGLLLESVIDIRGEVQAEFRLLRPDGEERTILAHAEPAMDAGGAVTHLYGAIQDVTDQRHMDRLKDAFLAAVSHEVRTPLTVVQGVASTLRRLPDVDEPRRRQLEEALLRNVDRLSQLLSDLLDLGRLQRGRAQLRPSAFDLSTLVRRLTATSTVAERIRVEGPPTLPVRADEIMIERILVYLLENVAKYAPAGPAWVRYAPLPGGGFRLSVEDEGPGIPDADLERIFRPFHRVTDQHPQPGTGIGLALVSEFAQAHDGRVWAESDGTGAAFIVEIPPTHGGATPATPET